MQLYIAQFGTAICMYLSADDRRVTNQLAATFAAVAANSCSCSQHSLVILSCSNSRENFNDGYSAFRYEQDMHTNGRKYLIFFRLRLHYWTIKPIPR
jgi:hypothetical protein